MRAYLEILRLVWPLALGMINNAVMQFVDRAYLARDSMMALEAVLPSGMLAWIFLGFFQAVIGYAGVFVAQYQGSSETEKCHDCYRAAVVLALASGVLMLPLWPAGDWILSLTASSEALYRQERVYYDILVLSGVLVFGQTAASAYFTGRGMTRIVFWVNLTGNLVNIALDPFLIFGWCGLPKMGIAGAAVATAFATGVQGAILMTAAHRHTRLGGVGCPLELLGRILRFGIPSGLYEVLNVTSFAIFVFVTGGVGDLELAVSNACFSVNYLLFAPMTGFALGAQTLVGQARGRGDNAAAVAAFWRTLALALGFVTVAGALMLAFQRPILALFAPPEAALSADFHALGFVLLLLMTTWMLFDATDVVVSGALKGAGDTRFVMFWMLFCSFALWLPLVFAVRHFHNTMPALWATMVWDVILLCIGSLLRWHCGHWRKINLV